jgi:hypothetical protein
MKHWTWALLFAATASFAAAPPPPPVPQPWSCDVVCVNGDVYRGISVDASEALRSGPAANCNRPSPAEMNTAAVYCSEQGGADRASCVAGGYVEIRELCFLEYRYPPVVPAERETPPAPVVPRTPPSPPLTE